MPVPVPLKISADTGAPGPVGYHIEGDSVPVLQVELNGTSIYFDHYVLLWKDPLVHIELKPQTKHLHRMRSGAPVFLTEARGPGHLALGRNGAGRAFAVPLRAGQSIEVHEHQFIAATDGVEFTCKKIKGPATMLFGGTSFNVETFRSVQDSGIVWLHGYGDVFEVTLQPDEQIDIEPGGWVYHESSVQLEPINQPLSTAILRAEQLAWHRFTGPGKVALQSMYLHQTVDISAMLKSAKYE